MAPHTRDFRHPSPESLSVLNAEYLIPLEKALDALEENAEMEERTGWRTTFELYAPPPDPAIKAPPPPEDPETAAREHDLTPRSYIAPFLGNAVTAIVSTGAVVVVAVYANKLTLHMPRVGVIGVAVLVPGMLAAQEVSKVADKISKHHELRALADRSEASRRRALLVGLVTLGAFALLRSFARYVPHGFQSLAVIGLEFAAVMCASASAALAFVHQTPGRHFGLARQYEKQATEKQVQLARLDAANAGGVPPPPSPPPAPPSVPASVVESPEASPTISIVRGSAARRRRT